MLNKMPAILVVDDDESIRTMFARALRQLGDVDQAKGGEEALLLLEAKKYDCILGSDVLYADGMHPYLRKIFETNLAPGGSVLISDPFRKTSFALLEAMEADGFQVTMSKWTVGIRPPPRPVGVFELTRP